jgi:serine phosphatase RsbU (regulator of sigma subunit)
MKVRTQLVVAFLLLSVVPLAALVLYSYASSQQAFRQAVESESKVLAEEMGERLASVRQDLGRRLANLSMLPVRVFVSSEEDEADPSQVYTELMAQMGDMSKLVESFEFTPRERADVELEGTVVVDDEADLESFVIYPSELLAGALEKLERRGLSMEESGLSEEYLESLTQQAIRSREVLEAGELEALQARGQEMEALLGAEFSAPVFRGDEVVGELRALVPPTQILRQVLSRTSREQGEIPYARDADGNLFLDQPQDRELLTEIGVVDEASGLAVATPELSPDWIVVETPDSESGLTFGVARPVQESLRGIRRTAVQNFTYGMGLVLLALIGVVALSKRMTSKLTLLTAGAERLADGDLEARVPLASRDEFGQLARTFNRMAQELRQHQDQILEQEVQQRLLEAENQRKGRELEEAREFQLSLLPKALPRHSEIEVAVLMRTATEVGGDYYDFFETERGALTTVIGDAAGHGVKAGTMVTVVKGLLTAGAAEADLAELLGGAATAIKQMNLGRMNMAATLVRIDDGRISISAAGMPPVLVHRQATGEVEEVALTGLPLGSMAEASYDQWNSHLEPGDTVLLMTDGFPELQNPEQEPLGYEKASSLFRAAAGGAPEEITTQLAGAAQEWMKGKPPVDDLTFVVLKMKQGA